jgi:hypothetical protein
VKLESLAEIFGALDKAGVRYLVVGGLAVVAHGYVRLTNDLDVVLRLERDNVLRALEALAGIGYAPRVPIAPDQFADRAVRERLIEEKGMRVLCLYSDAHVATPIDVFAREPFDFSTVYSRAPSETMPDGTRFRYADRGTLIAMKRAAGRPKDLDDVAHLEMLEEDDG